MTFTTRRPRSRRDETEKRNGGGPKAHDHAAESHQPGPGEKPPFRGGKSMSGLLTALLMSDRAAIVPPSEEVRPR
jgi:hypothetical protein